METELLPTFGWFLHKSFAPAELQGSSGKPGHDSCTIATSTAGSGNKLPVLLLASMLLTRCACLVDEAVILIAARGSIGHFPSKIAYQYGFPFRSRECRDPNGTGFGCPDA